MFLIALLTEHAKERAQMPPDWDCFRWECFPASYHQPPLYFEVEGAVAPRKQRGKHQGNHNWQKLDKATRRTVIITAAEHDAWLQAWQERTGGCIPCGGEGRRLKRWSVQDGVEYEPCPVCGGSGKAPIEAGKASIEAGEAA